MIHTVGDMFEVARILNAAGPVIIGHGVNQRGAYTAGVAGLVRNRWPEAYRSYMRYVVEWDGLGLGDADVVWVDPSYATPWPTPGLAVANMITQVEPGPDARLDAIYAAIDQVLRNYTCPLVVPLIGAGIGGLEPTEVMSMMEDFSDRLVLVTLT